MLSIRSITYTQSTTSGYKQVSYFLILIYKCSSHFHIFCRQASAWTLSEL